MLDTNTKNLLSKNTQADLFLPFIFLSMHDIGKALYVHRDTFLGFFCAFFAFQNGFCIFCPKLKQCLLSHKGTQQIKPCIATAESFYMQSSLGFFLVLQLALSKRWCPGLLPFLFFIFSH